MSLPLCVFLFVGGPDGKSLEWRGAGNGEEDQHFREEILGGHVGGQVEEARDALWKKW